MAVKRLWKRLPVFLLAFLMCAMSLPLHGLARGLVDTDHPATFTLQYDLSDAAFWLYRVADVSESGEFSAAGEFASYAVVLTDQDSAGWRALAETLDGYVQRDGLEPAETGRTSQEGILTFSGLKPGLYLVLGESAEKDGTVYDPMPFLVSLPGLDETDDWVYDVTSKVKYDKHAIPSKEMTERKVIKIWKDEGQENSRPKEISVQLLCDGKVYDTVSLSADNDWRYTWEELDADCRWQIVEKDVPEGYTVSASFEGSTFVLTNTCKTPEPAVPSETSPGNTPDKPSRLPYTGMLWTPVIFLALGGMLLFLIGWFRHSRWNRKS